MDVFCGEFHVASCPRVELASQDVKLTLHDDVKLVLDVLLSCVFILFEVHGGMVDDAFSPHVLMGVEDVEVFMVCVIQLAWVVVELVFVLVFVKL